MYAYLYALTYVRSCAVNVYIRAYKTAWHKHLIVIKFYGQPKLLRERKLTRF